MPSIFYLPSLLYSQGKLGTDLALEVEGGQICRVLPRDQVPSEAPKVCLPERAILPGFVNSHTHSWQVLLRGFGDDPKDFSDWVDRQLYPVVEALCPASFRAATAYAFTTMLERGVTTIAEFHYVHRGPQGEEVDDIYDRIVLEEAERLGVRLALLRTLYDRGKRPGQLRFLETPSQARGAHERMARRIEGHPLRSLQMAPHSLHGASQEMLEMVAELSKDDPRPFHIHLAEQESDLPLSQDLYGTTPLRALKKLGLLSEKTVLVHGIWLDLDEIRALGDAGGGIVINPWTNLHLGDGTTPSEVYAKAGVNAALGTDANTDPDMLLELRTLDYKARLKALAMQGLSVEEGSSPLDRITAHAAKVLGLPIGRLEAGQAADFLTIDLTSPSLQPGASISPEATLHQLIQSARSDQVVDEVYVAGQRVVQRGRATRVPSRQVAAEFGLQARRLQARLSS